MNLRGTLAEIAELLIIFSNFGFRHFYKGVGFRDYLATIRNLKNVSPTIRFDHIYNDLRDKYMQTHTPVSYA